MGGPPSLHLPTKIATCSRLPSCFPSGMLFSPSDSSVTHLPGLSSLLLDDRVPKSDETPTPTPHPTHPPNTTTTTTLAAPSMDCLHSRACRGETVASRQQQQQRWRPRSSWTSRPLKHLNISPKELLLKHFLFATLLLLSSSCQPPPPPPLKLFLSSLRFSPFLSYLPLLISSPSFPLLPLSPLFLFERSEKMLFFFSAPESRRSLDPCRCHVGKTFAPQLWFVADYCTGSGISLMK